MAFACVVGILAAIAPAPLPAGALAAKTLVWVGAGGTFSCGLTTDNTIICWGRGTSGELGDGLGANSATPVAVKTTGTVLEGKTIGQVSVGAINACALATDGTLACWGSNSTGRNGNGKITSSNLVPGPVTITGTPLAGKTITAVEAGGFGACAIADGAPYCWGGDQLGNGTSGTTSTVAVAVTTAGTPLQGKTVVQLSHGTSSTCALTSEGQAACWGANTAGAVGNGTTTAATVPVALATAGTPLAGKAIAQITRNGVYFHCARTTDGIAACWGNGANGRLGTGNAANSSVPVAVDLTLTPLQGKAIADLQGGEGHTCAVASDSTTACWGWNVDGALGTGSAGDSGAPVAVKVTGTALQGQTVQRTSGSSAVGHAHTCALLVGGTAACWGYNNYGQLGDGTTSASNQAVAVQGLVAGTPAVAPGAPSGVSAVAGDGQATVSWVAPSSNGGSPVTSYVITPRIGGSAQATVTAGGTATSKVVTGLVNGTTYTFDVRATNAVGPGAASAASGPVTPAAVATTPGAPTGVSAVAGNGQATVIWTAPASTGGSAITGYRITPSIGGTAQPAVTSTGTGTTKTVTGLANGTSYTFKVAAVNAIGTGALSTASAAVTPTLPVGPPYAPFASWSALVTRQYVDLTTKTPTPSQLSTWTTALANGTKTKGQLAHELRRGTENLTNVDPVVRVYRAFLGRAPDAGGLKFWIKRKRNVTPAKTWTVTQIATDFTNTSEFKTKYAGMTNRQFVTQIYTDVLERPADPSGVDYWTKKIDTKARTKAQVVVGFSESGEYQTKQAENTDATIAHVYLLGRAPTSTEATAWTTRQKAGTSHATLLTELLDSPAYAAIIAG